MTTTKKKVVNFCDEKSAPPEKILATPMPDRNMRRQKWCDTQTVRNGQHSPNQGRWLYTCRIHWEK